MHPFYRLPILFVLLFSIGCITPYKRTFRTTVISKPPAWGTILLFSRETCSGILVKKIAENLKKQGLIVVEPSDCTDLTKIKFDQKLIVSEFQYNSGGLAEVKVYGLIKTDIKMFVDFYYRSPDQVNIDKFAVNVVEALLGDIDNQRKFFN